MKHHLDAFVVSSQMDLWDLENMIQTRLSIYLSIYLSIDYLLKSHQWYKYSARYSPKMCEWWTDSWLNSELVNSIYHK